MEKEEAYAEAKKYLENVALIYELKREFKDTMDAKAKEADADFKSAEKEFYAALEAMNMETYSFRGYKYSRDTKKYYRPVVDREEFYNVLRKNGLGDIVKETVNKNTLDATIRELVEMNFGELPLWLAPLVSEWDGDKIFRREK